MLYPVIVILCYIIVTLIKRTSLAKEWFPLLSAGIGAVLAAISFCTLPQLVAADSILTAAFNGAISGLAATGGDQIFKQAVKRFCKQHGLDYDVVKTYLPGRSVEGNPADYIECEKTEVLDTEE